MSDFGMFSESGFKPKAKRKGDYPPRVSLVKGSPTTGTAYSAYAALVEAGAEPEQVGMLLRSLADVIRSEGWSKFEDRLEGAGKWWVTVQSE